MIALIYDSSGKVLQKLTGAREGIDIDIANSGHDGIFVDQDYDLGEVYIANGEVCLMPEQPTPAHVFNYATGQWGLDLSLAKSQKWADIKAARDAQEFGTFDWGGYTFQCDEVSQRRIQGAVQLAVMDTGFSIEWTLADNSAVTLTAQHMVEVGQALADHVNQGHVRARQLRAQIDAAQTQNEIDAITW